MNQTKTAVAELKRAGVSRQEIADRLGITLRALENKIAGASRTTLAESEVLGIMIDEHRSPTMTTTTIEIDSRLGDSEINAALAAYCDSSDDFEAAVLRLRDLYLEEIASRLPEGCWHQPATSEILGPVELAGDNLDMDELLGDAWAAAVARM